MPELIWDRVGDRVYETGLDKGVLYLPDGSAVPWNGLTSIVESTDASVTPVYYDGRKISDLVTPGDFSGSMKAVTYPDEFVELEGLASPRRGLFYAQQKPTPFALSYRNRIGDDVEGDEAAYKIHVLYNVTAIPTDKTFATASNEPSLMEFEWQITTVPEEIAGYWPTSHVIIDSREFDPWLLEELEAMLYGAGTDDPSLWSISELVSYINTWYRIKITDNGDGTWTAETMRDGFITLGLFGYFEIKGANALYLDEDTFEISDTNDITDVPLIKIYWNGDGTWTAESENEGVITIDPVTGEFELKNATAVYLDADTYQLSDTTDEI